eukprot:Sspe_Gene.23472::Locus_9116_Transcript_2_2_Confidence_0.667_Length_899::g.23472::m.23472/K12194/CHMP4, SNF7, VPS32; charged multivesicular body protein 4
MAFIGRFFGKKAPPPPNTNQTIENLSSTVDIIEKRENELNRRIDAENQKAKELLAKKNKQGAMQCIQRKKEFEKQLQLLAGQKMNLESMQHAAENAVLMNEVIKAQKTAAQHMTDMQKQNPVGKIEDLRDQVVEVMENQQEINDLMAQPINPLGMPDEDELLAELDLLEQEDLHKQLVGINPGSLPDLPKTEKEKKEPAKEQAEEEDDALAALEAELNAS